MRTKIDALAIKPDGYDTDFFINNIKNNNPESIIFVIIKNRIVVEYNPLGLDIKPIKLVARKLLFFLDIFIFIKVWTMFFLKYKPKVCLIENTYISAIIAILNRICLNKAKTIYISGDWLGNNRNSFISFIGSLVFIFFDYLACLFNNEIHNTVKTVSVERNKLYTFNKKEQLLPLFLSIKSENTEINKKKICFFGNIRKDSGLDIVMNSLDKSKQGFGLKTIGNFEKNEYYDGIKLIWFKPYIEMLGFTERKLLPELLSDCFCGINLITNNNSCSYYTIPSKILHYLQCLLPVIITEGCGEFINEVKKNRLGIVIKPTEQEFTNAVNELFNNQKEYRNNILNYIYSKPKIENIIGGIK